MEPRLYTSCSHAYRPKPILQTTHIKSNQIYWTTKGWKPL